MNKAKTQPKAKLPKAAKTKSAAKKASEKEKATKFYDKTSELKNGAAQTSAKREAILTGHIKEMVCEVCGNLTGRDFVGEWKPNEHQKDIEVIENDGVRRYWLRCQFCTHVELVEEWRIQVNRDKNLNTLQPKDCIVYSPQGIYTVGDAIYHNSLAKVGIVRSKQMTASGTSAITIEFRDLGLRTLLENVNIKADGTVSDAGKGRLKLKRLNKK